MPMAVLLCLEHIGNDLLNYQCPMMPATELVLVYFNW